MAQFHAGEPRPGPIQISRIEKALSNIRWESNSHNEESRDGSIHTVHVCHIGGAGKAQFPSHVAACQEAADKLHAEFGGIVTKTNAGKIVKRAEELLADLKAARPLLTYAAQEAERAEQAARWAKEKAEREANQAAAMTDTERARANRDNHLGGPCI